MDPVAGFFLLVIVLLVVFAARGIRMVQQSEQGLVEQFGKYQKTVGPGLRFIVPFIQNLQRVDMREQVVDVPPQEVITRDNVGVTVDMLGTTSTSAAGLDGKLQKKSNDEMAIS